MSGDPEHRSHRLLFRSYFFVVAALIAVATVLDFGFSHLQDTAVEEDRWIASTFDLIEAQLTRVPVVERQQAVTRIADTLGFGVQVLDARHVVTSAADDRVISSLVGDDGRITHLKEVAALQASILVGPFDPPAENVAIRLVPALFYLSIFVIIGLWLRPVLADLNLLTRASQRFAADYRNPLSTAEHANELRSLASNLDHMSARISGLIRSQKELTTALSHEMRTPLARIRFALAVADENADDELAAQLHAMSDDVQEIDQLIGSMLNYARLDHPEQRMDWVSTPLSGWADSAINRSRALNKTIDVVCDADAEFWMDPRLMGMALSNLVVNACRYAREHVRVRARSDAGSYCLLVEDDGEGVPEQEREAVFKAFTRLDTSRNRDTGGYGLGLAIVARIAELHGGRVSVTESVALGGAKFTVSWPHRRASNQTGSP
ncbi:MAG: ATP-binding protein [Pseudomonadota bacterium]